MDRDRQLFETIPSRVPGYQWVRCRACGGDIALTLREALPARCPSCHADTPPDEPTPLRPGIRDRLRATLSRFLRR